MSKLPPTALACFVLLFTAITTNTPSSARSLSSWPRRRSHTHQMITFLMRDVFNATDPAVASTGRNDAPFSNPPGLYIPPGDGAVLVPETTLPSPPRTVDLPGIGLSFPAKATLQELELGAVTDIAEDVFRPDAQLLGRARGMFVASAADGMSHMMAVRVSFGGEHGLRLFGVKKVESEESHIAVIGGVGKFSGANGYATVKRAKEVEDKLLEFSVFLS